MWSVGLYPKLESSKYNGYKEAWHLLRGETRGFVESIEGCAEGAFSARWRGFWLLVLSLAHAGGMNFFPSRSYGGAGKFLRWLER